MTKKPITADELMARLDSDPEHRAWQEAEDAKVARKIAERELAETPIVSDLAAVGVHVDSVWDLVNTRKTPSAALPILIEHLNRPYAVGIKEGIARALAVREAKFAWDSLKKMYEEETTPALRDALSIALSEAAHEGVLDDVIALASDKRHGESRLFLLSALKRSKDPSALATIQSLAVDPDFSYEVNRYLKAREKRAHRDRRRDHK
jgi:hypothetical protein